MTKPLAEPYYPAPVPMKVEDLPRYLEFEFQKLREALIAQPTALTVSETSTILVDTVPNYQRMFNLAPSLNWEVPGGTFDQLTGEWTCPQDGLYAHTVDLRVQPFGTGNKQYYAGIRITRVPADGSPNETLQTQDSGDDNFPLGVTLPVQLFSYAGDVWFTESTVVHDQFIGSVDSDSSWQISKVSL